METAARSRWDTVLRSTRTLLVVVLALAVLQQMCAPIRLAAARDDLLDRLQQHRRSRVIAMIHRLETLSLFGVPVSQSGQGRPSVMYVPLRRSPPAQGGGTGAQRPSGEDKP